MSKMEFNLLSFLQTKKLKKKGLTWAQHGILLNFLRDNESQTNDRNPREQGKKITRNMAFNLLSFLRDVRDEGS